MAISHGAVKRELLSQGYKYRKIRKSLPTVVRLHLMEYKTGIITDKEDIDPKRVQFYPIISELKYRILA